MKKLFNRLIGYFSVGEIILWCTSVLLITLSFFAFDRVEYMKLIASLIGVTALIFIAKGNPIGQMFMITFSIFYGIISFSVGYYGEMMTYLGMSMPMAIFSLISWLKNPYNENKSQVKINGRLSTGEIIAMVVLTVAVTAVFYFILSAFNTTNLIPSTVSVTTSFVAVFLSSRRNPCYALAYACNDIVLIVLWVLATLSDSSYISMVICFGVFLANDIYGFINWTRMKNRQKANA